MSLDSATEYLKQFGVEDRIQVFDVSSATVDLAAQGGPVDPESVVAVAFCYSFRRSPVYRIVIRI